MTVETTAAFGGVRPGSARAWVIAARPPTLSAALVPVAVGTACAFAEGSLRTGPALAALAGALLLQIAANFANDVFDFEKGADTAERLGPLRAVQAGLLSPSTVRRGLYVVIVLALAVGAYLTATAGPAIVVIGLASIAAAVAYTGGPYPLGYHGLGDVFVMLFFGFVAVLGTTFVQVGRVTELALYAAVPVGALATAILVVNNLRDIDTDRVAGKRTLAVRFGERGALAEYATLLVAAYAVPLLLVGVRQAPKTVLLPLLTLPLGVRLVRAVARERGRALNPLLKQTALLLLAYGLLFALGLVLAPLGNAR
ncbi:MAG TPA: 1,4-dihydroxy-2-naphthoate polyprenyltransferase [Polyangiaceae bacterium]|nr:1,4-dihydroxy-2-naphthoate polyprenyltransferase [Polyangiaceae bacterium]